MAEDVDVPGAGKLKREWVYVVVVGAAGIVAYAWWKRRNQAPPSTVDPQTGMDLSASTDGNTGFVNPHPVQSVIDTTSGGITTNPGWTAAVTEKLSSMFDLDFIGAVLGKYLSGQPLSADEASLVRTAWAYQGKPPEGPGTITLSGGGSTPGTPPPADQPLTAPTGLIAPDRGGDPQAWVFLACNPVPGATGYRFFGPNASGFWDAPSNSMYWMGLARHKTYQFAVAAKRNEQIGPKSASISVTTA